jgi:hypothetical protein
MFASPSLLTTPNRLNALAASEPTARPLAEERSNEDTFIKMLRSSSTRSRRFSLQDQIRTGSLAAFALARAVSMDLKGYGKIVNFWYSTQNRRREG